MNVTNNYQPNLSVDSDDQHCNIMTQEIDEGEWTVRPRLC